MSKSFLGLMLLGSALGWAAEDIDAAKDLARADLTRKVDAVLSKHCDTGCGEFRVDLTTALVGDPSGRTAGLGFENVAAGPKRLRITGGRITLQAEEGLATERLVAEVRAAATQVVDFPVSVHVQKLARSAARSVTAGFDGLAWARTLAWPLTLLGLALLAVVAFFRARRPLEVVAPEAAAEVEVVPEVSAVVLALNQVVDAQTDDLRFWASELARNAEREEKDLSALAKLTLSIAELDRVALSGVALRALAQALDKAGGDAGGTLADVQWLNDRLARARVRRLAARALPAEQIRSVSAGLKSAWMARFADQRPDEAALLLFLSEEGAWPRLLAPLSAKSRLAVLQKFHSEVGHGSMEALSARLGQPLAAELADLTESQDWEETVSSFVTRQEAQSLGMAVHGAPAWDEAIRSLSNESLKELCFELEVDSLAGMWDQAGSAERSRLQLAMPAGLRGRVERRASELNTLLSDVERRRTVLEAQAGLSRYLRKQGRNYEARA